MLLGYRNRVFLLVGELPAATMIFADRYKRLHLYVYECYNIAIISKRGETVAVWLSS